ncbi:MAG: histidine phosphatase family protein [Chloroflexi bacterium]|nr:histidine phosphatase family protein [Chloroflexota bacterium]
MRLILVRHGETAHNAGGFVQGRADNPLNELGLRQAAAVAESLKNEDIRVVVASPLQRAYETAAAIAAEHGLTVQVEPDLAEMDVGEMDGLSSAQMRERYPEFLAQWAGPEGPSRRMPGGESLEEVQARGWAVIERLMAEHGRETVVAASHNFVIVSIICRAARIPLASFRRFRQGVAARTVIDIRPDRSLIITLNDNCHLDRLAIRSGGPWEAPAGRIARSAGEQPAHGSADGTA